jgi:hypothetical protein
MVVEAGFEGFGFINSKVTERPLFSNALKVGFAGGAGGEKATGAD